MTSCTGDCVTAVLLRRNVTVRRPHRTVASCSRKRKAAQAARDARAEEGSDDDDMFGFINKQLAGPGGSPAAESGRKVEPARKVLFLSYQVLSLVLS